MNNIITHSGVIDKIDGRHITVRIVQTSACSACKASGYCNASETKVKLVDVYDSDTGGRRVGDAVTISADVNTGYRAVAWGFGIPLVIFMATIFAVYLLTGDDALAALLGIASLIPYYILLYLLRNKIRERLTFELG